MKLLTYDGSGRKMKHALLGCVGCAPSKHKGVRTKSPAYDDEDEAEDTWLLMSSQPPGLANLPEVRMGEALAPPPADSNS